MKKSKDQRVVITGIGLLTPQGIGMDDFRTNLLAGTDCFEMLDILDVSNNDEVVGATIKNFKAKDYIQQRKSLKVMSTDMQIAVAAAKLAIEDAGFSWDDTDAPSVGVSIGAGMIHTDLKDLAYPISAARNGESFSIQKFGSDGLSTFFPLWLLKQLPNLVASHISIIYNAQGPSNTLTTGSSAGLQAIGEATRTLERGAASLFICGGADCRTHPLDIIKYKILDLYCKYQGNNFHTAYGPYDKKRSGLLTGDASVIFMIETLSHAQKRGAKIYAEISGFGCSSGVGFLDTNIEKRAYIESIAVKAALRDAQCSADDIDCIIGHGCGSIIDDAVEALAYRTIFGDRINTLPVTSPSGATGYVGAATGPLNIACGIIALQDKKLAPAAFLSDEDEACDLAIVTGSAQEIEAKKVLVNTFDFFGQGSAMVLETFEE